MASQKRPLPSRDLAKALPERTIEGIFDEDYQDRAFDPEIGSGGGSGIPVVTPVVAGNLPKLKANGELEDSGVSIGATGETLIEATTQAGARSAIGAMATTGGTITGPLTASLNSEDDENYIIVSGADDRTRGFGIDIGEDWKWADYIYGGEDGDNRYIASGNSGRDILVMQSGGRVGLNVPTLIGNVDILRIVQTGSNTYATITGERPHRLANNTPIRIQGATNTKFNGNWTVSNVTTMTFRINGVEVGAVSEEPTDAQIVIDTTIPAGFAIFPQYFDSVYTFDKALDTGAGTGFTNITAEMRTSFGTATILPTTTGSCLYIGKANPWRATAVNIATASNGSSGITVEYSTATGWTALTTSTTSGNGLSDGTNRLRQDGSITWDLPTFKHLWKQQIIQVNASPQYTQNLYWIRILLTGTVTTAPIAYSISNHGIDRIAVYAQASDVNPTFAIDYLGRIGFLPPEIETKYQLGQLPGLTTSKFEVIAEDGYRSDFVYYLAQNDSDAHPATVMARSGGTLAAKTACTNSMEIGEVSGYSYDGSQFREVGKILFEHVGSASSGSTSGRIDFFTRNTTSSSALRMRITEAGRVELYSDVVIGGITNYTGTMGDSSKTVGTDAPADWIQVQIAGTTRYIPVYAA